MKKLASLLLAFVSIFSFFSFVGETAFASCYFTNGSVSDDLKNCKPSSDVITARDYKIEGWARERVITLINRIIMIGSIVSVGAIAYAGFLYATTMGDDERIKKGKTAVKFGIIGFVVMLISFPLVNAIVNFVYSIG